MQYKWFLSFFLTPFFCLSANASLEDHFVRIERKAEVHTMKNIDFIYMINLDSRKEKFARSCSQLEPYQIYPYRLSAINGWNLSVQDLQDIGLKYSPDMKKHFLATCYLDEDKIPTYTEMNQKGQAYFRYKMTLGMIGCLLSHLSVLQDALDSKYETIWVLEDDILVVDDPRQISELISLLDERVGKGNWDILFTDRDMLKTKDHYERCYGWSKRPNFTPKHPERFKMNTVIDETFRKIGARFGTHSMILRRSGIEKILNFIKTYGVFNPYDLDMYLPNDIEMYGVLHDIVGNEPGLPSDTKKKGSS